MCEVSSMCEITVCMKPGLCVKPVLCVKTVLCVMPFHSCGFNESEIDNEIDEDESLLPDFPENVK